MREILGPSVRQTLERRATLHVTPLELARRARAGLLLAARGVAPYRVLALAGVVVSELGCGCGAECPTPHCELSGGTAGLSDSKSEVAADGGSGGVSGDSAFDASSATDAIVDRTAEANDAQTQ